MKPVESSISASDPRLTNLPSAEHLRPKEGEGDRPETSDKGFPGQFGEDSDSIAQKALAEGNIIRENPGETRMKQHTNGYYRANGGFGSFNPENSTQQK